MTFRPKLVRDKIPDLIRARGATPRVRTIDRGDLYPYLLDKLREESSEFAEHPSLEELADILEVLRALAEALNLPFEAVEDECALKRRERGGFQSGVLLEGIDEPNVGEA